MDKQQSPNHSSKSQDMKTLWEEKVERIGRNVSKKKTYLVIHESIFWNIERNDKTNSLVQSVAPESYQ